MKFFKILLILALLFQIAESRIKKNLKKSTTKVAWKSGYFGIILYVNNIQAKFPYLNLNFLVSPTTDDNKLGINFQFQQQVDLGNPNLMNWFIQTKKPSQYYILPFRYAAKDWTKSSYPNGFKFSTDISLDGQTATVPIYFIVTNAWQPAGIQDSDYDVILSVLNAGRAATRALVEAAKADLIQAANALAADTPAYKAASASSDARTALIAGLDANIASLQASIPASQSKVDAAAADLTAAQAAAAAKQKVYDDLNGQLTIINAQLDQAKVSRATVPADAADPAPLKKNVDDDTANVNDACAQLKKVVQTGAIPSTNDACAKALALADFNTPLALVY